MGTPIGSFVRNAQKAIERLATPIDGSTVGTLADVLIASAARLDERVILRSAIEGTITNQNAKKPFEKMDQMVGFARDLSGGIQFTTMLVVLDPISGAGRYLIDDTPTLTHGLAIPAGGGQFIVRGTFPIMGFAIIATTATAIAFSALLFGRASVDRPWNP